MPQSTEAPILALTASAPDSQDTEPLQELSAQIAELETRRDRLQAEVAEIQASVAKLVQANLRDLERRKQALQLSIEQLERRQERIRDEMRTSFAGVSQDVAVRVQSFKDYLVGSLRDLAIAAERLELARFPEPTPAAPAPTAQPGKVEITDLTFAEPLYQEKSESIRQVVELFRNQPDYYGPPWKLRRTFEQVHADRVTEWFFTQGGRGAIRSLSSRLQNILVASATISILYHLYGDKLRPLILASSPERLGEWRRGLQDCLGLTRNEFGADRGVTLFEFAEPLAQRAERIQNNQKLPLIIIDETEGMVNLSLLQFPLWLAFAPNSQVLPPQDFRSP
jgi:hypothetical protein